MSTHLCRRSRSSTRAIVDRIRAASLLRAALVALLPLVMTSAWSAPNTAGTQRGEIEEIVVTADGSQVLLPGAYAGGQVATGGRVGILGNLDLMDTPFASANYTEKLIRDQQAKSIGDVMKNDPTVRVARGFGNFQELYLIRGFPVYSDDMTYNGLYGILPRQYVAAELLERVEVFRGSSAFLKGAAPSASGVGGSVNLVPKRAPDQPLNRVTLGFENAAQRYAAVDTARRLGRQQAFGVRFNAVGRGGEISVKNSERELTALSIGMDYRGERLRLSADIGYQDHRIEAPRPSVTPLGTIPAPPEANSNFAQPWTYTDEKQLFSVARVEYDFTDRITAWAAAGFREGEEGNVFANPDAAPDGDTLATRFDNDREDSVFSTDAGVRGTFTTGRVGHRLIFSASHYTLESRNAFAFSDFAGFSSNLYDPVDVAAPSPDAFVGGDLDDPLVTEQTETNSVAVADMLSLFDERVLLTGGVRLQNIQTEAFDYNTGIRQSGYDRSEPTPVAGLVVKPVEGVSVYGNYIQALVPGDVAPNTSGSEPVINAGEVFDPYKAEQIEAGVKVDTGRFGGTASVFAITLPSAYVENNVFSADGEQRNRGFELSVYGKPLPSVKLLGGLTLVNAEEIEARNAAIEGNDAVGVPDTQANVNVEWALPAVPGLTLESRAIYTSSQHANPANTLGIDAYTRFDAGARYTTQIAGRELSLRARLDNITDRDYWASVGGFPGSNYLVLGDPRTFQLSASLEF